MRTAVIAALPREIAALTRGWQKVPVSRAKVFAFERDGNVVTCAGIGPARVTLAVEAALAHGPVDRLLSVGLAGACDPTLHAGQMLRAATILDARTGERFQTGEGAGLLVTAASLAGSLEKGRLHRSYAAAAVEMEAATVARLATARGLLFGALKAISDEADADLDELERFTTREGQFRTWSFALHTALRPTRWRAAVELGHNSALALRALTSELQRELEKPDERRDV